MQSVDLETIYGELFRVFSVPEWEDIFAILDAPFLLPIEEDIVTCCVDRRKRNLLTGPPLGRFNWVN